MAIILKATLSVLIGADLSTIEIVLKRFAAAINEIEAITGKGSVDYDAVLTNRRVKGEGS